MNDYNPLAFIANDQSAQHAIHQHYAARPINHRPTETRGAVSDLNHSPSTVCQMRQDVDTQILRYEYPCRS